MTDLQVAEATNHLGVEVTNLLVESIAEDRAEAKEKNLTPEGMHPLRKKWRRVRCPVLKESGLINTSQIQAYVHAGRQICISLPVM